MEHIDKFLFVPSDFVFSDNIEKSLTPRDIPRSDSISNIRALEDNFVKGLADKYEQGTKEIIKMAKVKGMTKEQLQGDLDAFTEQFMKDAMDDARIFSEDAYALGMESELKSLGVKRHERFTQIDQNALTVLSKEPHSIFNSIKTFGDENVSQFKQIIEDAYAGEFDLTKMVKDMEEVSGGKRVQVRKNRKKRNHQDK